MSISVSRREIYGIPGRPIILNVQIEHPYGSWKKIKVTINFHPILRMKPFEHTISEPNEVGFTVLRTEIVLPPDLGEFKMGEIIIEINGKAIAESLPTIHVLTLDGYFEEMVAQQLRLLGFSAKRWGGPDNPDIEAYHPDFPTQKYQVEATIEKNYSLVKYRQDIGKFHDLKDKFGFKRLLLVPFVDQNHISKEVLERLRKTSDPISLICFRALQNLCERYRKFHISKYEVIAILNQTGFIKI